tara:strand:+ start:77050 stop:77436 length:387 start_codon:yes stop_codon:yes gene_type:complete
MGNLKSAKFFAEDMLSSKHLDATIKDNINDKKKSYYLIVNEWDDPCKVFRSLLSDHPDYLNKAPVHVIDTFNVPNALGVIRSSIKEYKETISTSCLSGYSSLPMLVVLHKAFPRIVTYNGGISAELGV